MLLRLRLLLTRIVALVLFGSVVGLFSIIPEQMAISAPLCTTQVSATPTSVGGPAYYLFESNGTVVSCGGAPLHGSRPKERLSNPIVTGAATTAGGGYWLASAKGDVFAYGDATLLGSPAHLHLRYPIVDFAPTPDGNGYWLVATNGSLFHFGDARFYGSTVHDHSSGDVVSILPTPDGNGYWIVTTMGIVRNYGDAPPVGSLGYKRPQVIAAAASPDGHGIVILTKDGGVHHLGTSGYFGSLVHHRLPRPLTSIASTPDGNGYFLANASGSIFRFGDAAYEGSLAASPPRRPTRVVAVEAITLPAPTILTSTLVAPGSILPRGAFGYDVSNFQCASPGSTVASPALPSSSTFSVIEVAGWLDSSQNSCLASEAAWATSAAGTSGSHYSLYLFTNSPDKSPAASALDQNGPAGSCATLTATSVPLSQTACLAYNYGYEGAVTAYNGALAVGVSSSLWWLDVEGPNLSSDQWSHFSTGNYWSNSPALNDETIQGAIDALRGVGITVGIYSSSVQYPVIAGQYVPSGNQIPLWVAGAPWTNPPYTESGLPAPGTLTGWCAGTSGYGTANPSDLFAGGVPWVLQETPGSEPSPYRIDPDYTC
ncbi:MAG TPA: hypothetical protein VMU99_08810 [Acidimicrobiales bacterium]|nr:hypothetical protein [Acidimicrobiales bacterium]